MLADAEVDAPQQCVVRPAIGGSFTLRAHAERQMPVASGIVGLVNFDRGGHLFPAIAVQLVANLLARPSVYRERSLPPLHFPNCVAQSTRTIIECQPQALPPNGEDHRVDRIELPPNHSAGRDRHLQHGASVTRVQVGGATQLYDFDNFLADYNLTPMRMLSYLPKNR